MKLGWKLCFRDAQESEGAGELGRRDKRGRRRRVEVVSSEECATELLTSPPKSSADFSLLPTERDDIQVTWRPG